MVQLTVREEMENAYAPMAPVMGRALESPLASSPIFETESDSQDVPTVAKQVLENLLRVMGIRSQVVIHTDIEGEEGPAFVLDIVVADLVGQARNGGQGERTHRAGLPVGEGRDARAREVTWREAPRGSLRR